MKQIVKYLRDVSVFHKLLIVFVALASIVLIGFIHVRSYQKNIVNNVVRYHLASEIAFYTQQIGVFSELVVREKKNAKIELERTSNLFEKYFYTLKNGGELVNSNLTKSIKPAGENAHVLIQTIEKKWYELKDNVEIIINEETFQGGIEMSTGSMDATGKYVENEVFKPINIEVKKALISVENKISEFIRLNNDLINLYSTELNDSLSFRDYLYTLYLVLFLVILILSALWLRGNIVQGVSLLRKYIANIARGSLTDTTDYQSNDEIGQSTNLLTDLRDNLKSAITFINRIGSGDLSAEYSPKSENDELGKSLVKMKEAMAHAADEEGRRKREDEIRNWTTHGVAKFGDLLRQNNDNLDELAFSIIANLIQYVEANQGGIFVLEENDQENPWFRLSASYAYDRRKFHQKRMEWGESLVGRVALERKTLFLTEVPSDYLEISSGLGEHRPACILITPLMYNNFIFGVIEIASFKKIEQYQINFIEQISESIASTFSTVKINVRTAILLKESKEQAERLAQQEEEMRQNLEEMQATQEESAMRTKELEGVFSAIDLTFGTYDLDLNGHYIKMNDRYREFLSLPYNAIDLYSFKEVIKQHFEDETELDAFWTDIADGCIRTEEFCYKNEDGDVWLQESFSPVRDVMGDIRKIVVIVNNITENKKREQEVRENLVNLQEHEEELNQNIEELHATQDELSKKDKLQEEEIARLNAANEAKMKVIAVKEEQSRKILETSLDGVITMDEVGKISFFNKSAERIWGYKQDEIVGQNVRMLMTQVHAPHHDGFLSHYKQTGERKIIGIGREVPILRKDKSETYAFLSVIETTVDDKTIYTAFIKDLTKEKEMEAERDQLMEGLIAKEFESKSEIEKLQRLLENKASDETINISETLISWKSTFSVSNEEIDEQHKKLIDLINRLFDAFKLGKAKREVKQILKDLVSYTAYHFGTEERYFKEYNYEHANAHIQEHRKLVEQVVDFQNQLESGKLSLSYEIMNFLKDWLEKHILESDMRYVSCFMEHTQSVAVVSPTVVEEQNDGTLIRWIPEYNISIQLIDEQHKVLVDLINQLFSAFKEGKAKKQMKVILKGLVDYTDYHFGVEERYFKEFEYQDTEAHLKQHRAFVDKIKTFQQDFNDGRVAVSYEVMKFLQDWLINHILKTDRDYVSLFKEKGVE